MAPVNSLRILCYGDSLTSGFHDYGLAAHPYSHRLDTRLREAFPDLAKIHVVPNGVPGDRVMNAGFITRLMSAGQSARSKALFALRLSFPATIELIRPQWNEEATTGFSSSVVLSMSSVTCDVLVHS